MDALKLQTILLIGTALHLAGVFASKCVPIQADVCKQLNHEYNYTLFPNDFSSSQGRSLKQFNSFNRLVQSKCSPVLTQFLCAYHFPPCTFQHVWPCQAVCEMARRDCEPVLKRYGYVWPSYFNCSRFPARQPCVNSTSSSDTSNSTAVSSIATPQATGTPTVSLDKKCMKINVSTCAALHPKYVTYFPHKNYIYQQLAVLQFESFHLLLRSNCSKDLRSFLCLSHFPACVESNELTDLQLVYPCRRLCRQVKTSCEPVLANYDLSWPAHLNCDSFPNETDKFCADSTFLSMIPKPTTAATTTTTSATPVIKPTEVTTMKGCQPIDPRVKRICGAVHKPFTHTSFPHGKFSNQSEAYDKFIKFLPFIESNCSAELRAFLCYEYFPPCALEKPNVLIKPCRSVCRKAQTGCGSCFKTHNIQLPSCNKYKVKGTCLSLAALKSYLRNAVTNKSSCPPITATSTPTPSGMADVHVL